MNKKIFFKEFKIGIKSHWEATTLILNNKMVLFFIIPLIINILLLFFGLKYIFQLTEYSTEAFKNWINFESKDFWGHNFLNDFLTGMITVIIYIIFFIAYMLISGNIILILMSPVLSLVSEKIENLKTNTDYPFSWKQLFKDILRGTIISIRNSVFELLIMFLMLIISFIPVIGLVSPIILFLTSAYYFGFSFMDYTNERKKLSVIDSIRYVKKHKGLAYSNGMIFSLILMIPFCGSSIAAFFSIISVGAATLSINEISKNNHEKI